MVTKAIPPSPVKSGQTLSASPFLPPPDLPTFDWDVGYKEIYNPKTGKTDRFPLTLLDLLYPQEEQEGVLIVVTQSFLHDLWTAWLKVMLQNFLGSNWLITHDVLIRWDYASGKSPDIAAFPNTPMPTDQKSYRVGIDGASPVFVLEIISDSTRQADLHAKRLHYAAVGIKEYLIIDLSTASSWQLLGYRLEDRPFYNEIRPDSDGGLTFATIGLRFVAPGDESIDVYEIETGQKLLRPDELKSVADAESARADAESARADAEAEARVKAETRIAELEARLYTLQAGSQAEPPEIQSDE